MKDRRRAGALCLTRVGCSLRWFFSLSFGPILAAVAASGTHAVDAQPPKAVLEFSPAGAQEIFTPPATAFTVFVSSDDSEGDSTRDQERKRKDFNLRTNTLAFI